MSVRITTNNKPRPIIYWHELTLHQQEWFSDFAGAKDAAYFVYKGSAYCLNEFMKTDGMPSFKDWDGYANDSFYSGVVIKHCKDNHGNRAVVVGWYMSLGEMQ